MLPRLLDKACVIFRRDLLTTIRYRTGFSLGVLSGIAEIAAFYYLAHAVGPGFHPEGMDYYPFLLVGTGFYTFLIMGINSFLTTVQEAQQTGTFEVLMTTSTPPPILVLLSALSPFVPSAHRNAQPRRLSPGSSVIGEHRGCNWDRSGGDSSRNSERLRSGVAPWLRSLVSHRNAFPRQFSAQEPASLVFVDSPDPRAHGHASGAAPGSTLAQRGSGTSRPQRLLRCSAALQFSSILVYAATCPCERDAFFLLNWAGVLTPNSHYHCH